MRSSAPSGSGRSSNERTIRRPRTTSRNSISPSVLAVKTHAIGCKLTARTGLSDLDEHPLAVHRPGHQPPQAGEDQAVGERSQTEAGGGREEMVIEPHPR